MSDETLRGHGHLYKVFETAFDAAAKLYDVKFGPPSGSRPGNPLVTWLRDEHLALLKRLLPEAASLLDIGCGTGEEAIRLAQDGYSVLGIDVSPAMVRQAQTKAAAFGIRRGLLFKAMPAGQVANMDERGPFHGAFASLGTLNTEPDLPNFAAGLHAMLEPGAPLVATVMSTRCLFERLHPGPLRTQRFTQWREGRAGASDAIAPVRFYSPSAFAAALAPHFTVERVIAFPLWLPSVPLADLYRQHEARFKRLEARERRTRGWPVLRTWGDHFLMVLRRAEE